MWRGSHAAWNTTNCMSGNCRDTATMSSGPLYAGSKWTSGRPLWATSTRTPMSWACWTMGNPIDGSSSDHPWAAGLHAVYTLNALSTPEAAAAVMSSRHAASGPTLGAMTRCSSTRGAPAAVRSPIASCVPRAASKGTGASDGPELGTSVSMATVVSLARKRSCRYDARSTHVSGSAALHPYGSMPSTRPTVEGALRRHGPSGITWWVWTSKMNSPWLPRACSHAATSVEGGAAKVPPAADVDEEDEDDDEDDDDEGAATGRLGRRPAEQAASSYTDRAAAMPPAERR